MEHSVFKVVSIQGSDKVVFEQLTKIRISDSPEWNH